MYDFWFLLFLIKLYSHTDIFQHVKKKHGKKIFTIVKSFESAQTKYTNILLDIKFIKTCKIRAHNTSIFKRKTVN